MPDQEAPSRRRIFWRIAGVAVACAVVSLAWWWLAGRAVWTDGTGLRVSEREAKLRQVVWTVPRPLGPESQTAGAPADQQYEPSLSPDGTEFYFVRGKPGGGAHIHVSYRRDNAWTRPVPLDAINSRDGKSDDLGPRLTADGNFLLFYSDRPGGLGGYDIWAAPRAPGGWGKPFNLGPTVNSEFNEYSPDPTPDGKRLIFSTNRKAARQEQTQAWRGTIRENSAADYDLWIAERAVTPTTAATRPASPSLAYQPAAEIAGINTPSVEGASCMSPAGDFLYFASNRPGGFGKFDLYRSRLRDGTFGPAENLGPTVNTADNEADPQLASGGYRLYFSSDRGSPQGVYALLSADSREVFREREGRPLPHLGLSGWLLLVSAVVLLPMILFLRGVDSHRLNLLQLCLVWSLLIHAIATFIFSFVFVTQEVARYVRREVEKEVVVSLNGPRDLAIGSAIRGQVSDDLPANVAPPVAARRASSVLTTPAAAARVEVNAPRALAMGSGSSAQLVLPDAPPSAAPANYDVRPQAPASADVDVRLAVGRAVAASEAAPPGVTSEVHTPKALSESGATRANALDTSAAIDASAHPSAAPVALAHPTSRSIPVPTESGPSVPLETAAAPDAVANAGPTAGGPKVAGGEAPVSSTSEQKSDLSRREHVNTGGEKGVSDVTAAVRPAVATPQAGDLPSLPSAAPTALATGDESAGPSAIAPSAAIDTPSATQLPPGNASRPVNVSEGVPTAEDAAPKSRGRELAAAPAPGRAAVAVPSLDAPSRPAGAASPLQPSIPSSSIARGSPIEPGAALVGPSASATLDGGPQVSLRGPLPSTRPTTEPSELPSAVAVAWTTGRQVIPSNNTSSTAATIALAAPVAPAPPPSPTSAALAARAKTRPPLDGPAQALPAPDVTGLTVGAPDNPRPPVERVISAQSRAVGQDDRPHAVEADVASGRQSTATPNLSAAPAALAGSDSRAAPVQRPSSIVDAIPTRAAPVPPVAQVPGPDADRYATAMPAAEVSVGLPPLKASTPLGPPAVPTGGDAAATTAALPLQKARAKTAASAVGPDTVSVDLTKAPVSPADAPLAGPAARTAGVRIDASGDATSPPVAPATALDPLAGALGPTHFAAPDSPFRRAPEQRKPLVDKMGGTAQSEGAVERGLAYLARVQEPDGRWGLVTDGSAPGRRPPSAHDQAFAGLATLAFLAQDHTPAKPGPYRATVQKSLAYLVASQADDGDLRGPASFRGEGSRYADMYDHAIATLALSEAAIMTHDPHYAEAALRGAKFIIASQNRKGGGWRYVPGQMGDTSVLGWQVMAMHSCERLGFEIPQDTRRLALRFIDSCTSGPHKMLASYLPGQPPTPVMTAEMLYCRMLLGEPLDAAAIKEATDFLAQHPPDAERPDLYYWYYASLSMMQVRSESWKQWNALIRDNLIRLQRRGGASDGSWGAELKWGDRAGRIFTTATATLTLEVYYRYLPLKAESQSNAGSDERLGVPPSAVRP